MSIDWNALLTALNKLLFKATSENNDKTGQQMATVLINTERYYNSWNLLRQHGFLKLNDGGYVTNKNKRTQNGINI